MSANIHLYMHYTHTHILHTHFFWRKEKKLGQYPLKVSISSLVSEARLPRNEEKGCGVEIWEKPAGSEIASVTDRSSISWLRVPGAVSVLPFFSWAPQCSRLRFSLWPLVPKTIVPQVPNLGNFDKFVPHANLWRLSEQLGAGVALVQLHLRSTTLRNLTLVSEPQGHWLPRSHFLLSRYTNHYWAHWASDQTRQSKPQWHAMSAVFPSNWETATWGREKIQRGYYLLAQGLEGRTRFLVGCYQDGHPCQRVGGDKRDLILYYLPCFSGSELTLELLKNGNPNMLGSWTIDSWK